MSNRAILLERPLAGPGLALLLSVALVGLCAATYWHGAGSLYAVRSIDRLTIRIALVLFSLMFAAAALQSLFPGKMSDWLLSNQRNITIAFVVAFALHLCAIARFYNLEPTLFWSVSPVFLIVLRGIGVGFIALLFVQSLGKIGPDRWRMPMAFGSYYVWGAFFAGFAKRITQDPIYLLPVALLVGVLILRFVAGMRRT